MVQLELSPATDVSLGEELGTARRRRERIRTVRERTEAALREMDAALEGWLREMERREEEQNAADLELRRLLGLVDLEGAYLMEMKPSSLVQSLRERERERRANEELAKIPRLWELKIFRNQKVIYILYDHPYSIPKSDRFVACLLFNELNSQQQAIFYQNKRTGARYWRAFHQQGNCCCKHQPAAFFVSTPDCFDVHFINKATVAASRRILVGRLIRGDGIRLPA